jgi:hypothetical protein
MNFTIDGDALPEAITVSHDGVTPFISPSITTGPYLGPTAPPLDHPAMEASLSTLLDLWECKFGDRWVRQSELDDMFWKVAAQRLANKDYLEEFDVPTEYQTAFKLCK